MLVVTSTLYQWVNNNLYIHFREGTFINLDYKSLHINCYSAFGTSNIVLCQKGGNPQLKKMDDVQVTNGDILENSD